MSVSTPTAGIVANAGGNNTHTGFRAPSWEEVEAYAREVGKSDCALAWFNHYRANGWMAGQVPMSDWHASLINWQPNKYAVASSAPDATEEARSQREIHERAVALVRSARH